MSNLCSFFFIVKRPILAQKIILHISMIPKPWVKSVYSPKLTWFFLVKNQLFFILFFAKLWLFWRKNRFHSRLRNQTTCSIHRGDGTVLILGRQAFNKILRTKFEPRFIEKILKYWVGKCLPWRVRRLWQYIFKPKYAFILWKKTS